MQIQGKQMVTVEGEMNTISTENRLAEKMAKSFEELFKNEQNGANNDRKTKRRPIIAPAFVVWLLKTKK